jgi:hypothetical protein
MKIKLAYPKIPDTLDCPLKQCVAFEKLDGTNIHFVFRKTGFLEFGTRRDRFSYSSEGWASFKQAHPELSSLQDDSLDLITSIEEYFFSNKKYELANEVILFFEYCGPNSFAGQHQDKDEKKLNLIDSQIDGRMLPPEEFLEDFKGCDYYLPRVIFKGKFTGQLFVDVRKGKYDVKEGVVVKGLVGKEVYMAKIKTEAYLDRLKNQFKDNWKEYWE